MSGGASGVSDKYKTLTQNDLANWGFSAKDFLLEILRGEYDLDEAREDLLSFRNDKETQQANKS